MLEAPTNFERLALRYSGDMKNLGLASAYLPGSCSYTLVELVSPAGAGVGSAVVSGVGVNVD